ncbi:hypothetical protein OROGR_014555 [Orobanche gracilis]
MIGRKGNQTSLGNNLETLSTPPFSTQLKLGEQPLSPYTEDKLLAPIEGLSKLQVEGFAELQDPCHVLPHVPKGIL